MLFTLIFLLLGTFIFSYSSVYASLKLSHTLGAIDVPNGRKEHSIPTARTGGLAFFVAFFVFLMLSPVGTELKISLLPLCTAVFLVGLFDDACGLSPIRKLTGQISGAAIYVFFSGFESPLVGAFTLLWIVFLSNAINLTDGLNGLAGGISATQSLCLACVSVLLNNREVMICSLLLFASIVGFLPSNFPRARIFMGDCGALFLGATLGALSSRLVIEDGGILGVISVLLIFRIPIADTLQSFFRRTLRGKNPFAADRGHFHHRLVDIGFTRECATLALVSISLFFGLLGIVVSFIK